MTAYKYVTDWKLTRFLSLVYNSKSIIKAENVR